EYGLFIDGATTEAASGELRDLSEPATGEPLGRAAMAGDEDVDRAVEAARAALDGPWGKTPGSERSRLLHALADAIAANRGARAGARGRLCGRAEAGPADAADGAAARRARGRGRLPAGRDQHRPRGRADDGRLPGAPPRRRQGGLHRLDQDRR